MIIEFWLLISNFARLKWKILFESGVVSLYWAREKFRVELEKLHRNSLLGARIRLVSQTDLLVDPGGGAGIVWDEFFGFEPKADLVVGGFNRVCQTVKKPPCQYRLKEIFLNPNKIVLNYFPGLNMRFSGFIFFKKYTKKL